MPLPLTGKLFICGGLYPGLYGVDRQKGREMRECGVLCPQTSLAVNPTLWETAHPSAGTYRVGWNSHGSLWMQRGKEVMAGTLRLEGVEKTPWAPCQVHGLWPLLYFVMTIASVALGQLLVNSSLCSPHHILVLIPFCSRLSFTPCLPLA